LTTVTIPLGAATAAPAVQTTTDIMRLVLHLVKCLPRTVVRGNSSAAAHPGSETVARPPECLGPVTRQHSQDTGYEEIGVHLTSRAKVC
jgi:hypothetical protein